MRDAVRPVPRHVPGLVIYSLVFRTHLTKKAFNLLTEMALTVTLPDGYCALCWIFTDY